MARATITNVPLSALEGALAINTHGAEYRICGFSFNAGTAQVVIEIAPINYKTGNPDRRSSVGVLSLEGWTIQPRSDQY